MTSTITTYAQLEEFGRTRLSSNFFMREFLHSEIAVWHGMRNIPENPAHAIWAGQQLCNHLLEPLQATFGRIHVRSGYRSPEVNAFGNRHQLNCASNERNFGKHIWDYPDAQGHRGATACIVVPWLLDYIERGGHWTAMAWWIHDHLPYGSLYFFSNLAAFNIQWSEAPTRRVDSYAAPKGCLIAPGTPGKPGLNAQHYPGFPAFQGHATTGAKSSVAPVTSPPTRPVASVKAAVQVSATAPVHAATVSAPKPAPQPPRPAATAPLVAGAAFAASSVGAGKVLYRAVHTKTKWRKAANHSNLESAIRGPNGASALFRGKVRIDYTTHGEPLFALVWQEGAQTGSIIRAEAGQPDGIRIVTVPVGKLQGFDALGGVSERELASYFTRA